MTGEQRHVVVVVANGITGDSRVIKTALAAARAGWRVTLLGLASGERREAMLGPVRVVRVPIQRHQHDAYQRSVRTVTGKRFEFAYSGASQTAAAAGRLRRYARRVRGEAGRSPRRVRVEAELLARRLVHRVRAWGAGEETVVVPEVSAEQVQWRRDWPILLDWAGSFGPVLEELEPDLVHANDVSMIGVVAEAVRRMRAAGRTVSWIYDAHEHVSAVDWGGAIKTAAYCGYEREYIDAPDAVVTVSTEIAELLEAEYALATRPSVVRNTPIRHVDIADPPSVRQAAGVPDGVPLLVYSGYLARERGIDTIIASLTRLPEVWLAVVTAKAPLLDELLQTADELGVQDRIGVAPYVPPHAVPSYLSSADLGVIASLHSPNYEASTPTKLTEYVHARLPLVVSDLRANSDFVRRHGVGEVFVAGDPESLASAVGKALRRRDELRANLTDALLDSLSWETEAATLLGVYTAVTGHRPEPPVEPVGWDVVEVTREHASLTGGR